MRIVRDGSDGAIYVLSWDLSTAISRPGEDGSKPCSISHRTATRHRNDHHARIYIEVDVTAVPCDDVAKVLRVSECQDGEVEQGIALGRHRTNRSHR